MVPIPYGGQGYLGKGAEEDSQDNIKHAGELRGQVRENDNLIQAWRIRTGKDRIDPATWFRLQGAQIRKGATSTRGHKA